MNLSIIIVSFNVSHFLEQCLKSVIKASYSLPVDIYVVDNHSGDNSVSMVQKLFPQVKLIVNNENRGFSKANNQAILLSESDYILLLNPDTVIEEETLTRTLTFMETHPDAGGLGIKMIDGYGHFLPESKRGLPTPWASFCKMSHLSQLFRRSAFFNQYYAGWLGDDEINRIEVLAGAFMLLRRNVLDRIGLLDEDFFMYGEDIDLSYRITKAGYHNYYFPEARMIHYKGESTRKSSLNYVKLFYGAMLIFARKHFAGKNEWLLSLFILPGVYFRAAIAMIYRLLNSFSHSSFLSFVSKRCNLIFSSFLVKGTINQAAPKKRVVLIVANPSESTQIAALLNPDISLGLSTYSVTIENEIRNKIDQYHPGEIIFSASDFTTSRIITLMCRLKGYAIPFRIAHTDHHLIIGSNFVNGFQATKVKV
jgi:GT2 family glycosyltransferase